MKKLKAQTIRFLAISIIGIILFCTGAFSLLGFHMSRKSAETIQKLGDYYMSAMSEQITKHFETLISLRLSQVEAMVATVPPDLFDQKTERDELVGLAQARMFYHVALYSYDGTFEALSGNQLHLTDPQPFLNSIRDGKEKVAVGKDSIGSDLILLGIPAAYSMSDGQRSIALIVAMPVDYLKESLSLEEDMLVYSRIIRNDGSYVIQSDSVPEDNYFDHIRVEYAAAKPQDLDIFSKELQTAMEHNQDYSALLDEGGYRRQIHSTCLPYSEWNLLTIMPYGELDELVTSLDQERTQLTILSCGMVLVLLIIVFLRYLYLTNLQLKALDEARQKAVQATKAKSEFLSNMSHDIRTPMNAIVGMTAIATANIENREQVQNCLKKIALSSKHLLGLINDVLDMSKIESGKMTLNMDQVSLREVVEDIVTIVQPQVTAKKQNFGVHIDNITTENVCCDGVRLNQVLLNLLSNAVKYTQEGGSIELSLYEEESPHGGAFVRTHVKVKDNGIGMTPEFMEKIFETYSREDSARVHKTEGAGLGMAITKYIVDAMGGTIQVQSELGAGSEFHVILDLEKAVVKEVDMVLPDWKVLVVDDDELLCKTTAASLKSIGVRADWTMDGESAVQMTVQHHQRGDDYQVILLDWKLPGMDGVQTARELRAKLGSEVPILLISAYDWSDFEEEARAAGINGFISKPLFKSTLFYGLQKYMGVEKTEEQEQEQDIKLTGRRVLLAEDNELNREVAIELLAEVGLEVEEAEDGKICLEKFQQNPEGYYDAILMDIRMPVMNGYEATQAIRALDRPDAAKIPIIAMTADAFSDDIQHCLSCGMNAHTAKPINLPELCRLLERYIGKAN